MDIYQKIFNETQILNTKKIYECYYDNNKMELKSPYEIYNNNQYYSFKNWYCEAGLSYFYIDINGLIYPCLNYLNKKVIGNIFDLDSLIFKSQICKYDKCQCAWEVLKYKIFNKKYE
jgi:MoaA/NifB/PqqE/SkfB family radical SAM enzyme